MIPLYDNVKTKTFAFVTYALIAVNIYVFVQELKCPSEAALELFVRRWAVIPAQLWPHFSTHWKSLITAAFLHGGWTHLIGNMLFLFVFGRTVEDNLGHFRFLLFYLAAGMIANGVQAFAVPTSTLPLVGASGAIAGVLGSYFFSYPYARIVTLIPFFIFYRIIALPAFLFLGLWFLLQMVNGTWSLALIRTQQDVGGVAWWAHAAGFVAGLLITPALAKKRGKFK